MAFTNTPFIDGNVITESDLKDRIDNFEQYVNGGSVAADLAHGEWVQPHHIYRPDFIGGSNDRGEFCTGSVFYRLHSPDKVGAEIFHRESRGGDYQVVNGLNVTVKAYRPMLIIYTASWHAWETGSTNSQASYVESSGGSRRHERINDETYPVARFKLYLENVTAGTLNVVKGSRRMLYWGLKNKFDEIEGTDASSDPGKYGGWSKSTGKQMSTHYIFSVDPGIYNVGIRCLPTQANGATVDGASSQNIFVRPRSCVVDCHFTTST